MGYEKPLGNLYQNHFKHIWNDHPYREFRDKAKNLKKAKNSAAEPLISMALQADTQLCSRDIRIAVDHLGIGLVDLNSFGDDAADTPCLMA